MTIPNLCSRTLIASLAVLLFCTVCNCRAGSATWASNPTSGDWNSASNWSPATVPNSGTDEATFGPSAVTNVTISSNTTVGQITFAGGAQSYTITTPAGLGLTLSDRDYPGISNNSNLPQYFVAASGLPDALAFILIDGEVAGSPTSPIIFTAKAPAAVGAVQGFVQAEGLADTGKATLISEGGMIAGTGGGEIDFINAASADQSVVTSQAATVSGATGGMTIFWMGATAHAATVTAEGATVAGAGGGVVRFIDHSYTGRATLIANGGANGGGGGTISFEDGSSGGRAHVEVFGNGLLDLSGHTLPNVIIGSLEGDGQVTLGKHRLGIGRDDQSTVFAGVISGSGAISKTGSGSLTLSGASSYTGQTLITGGTLLVDNQTGSATGTGLVQVQAGTLGGNGVITGQVRFGSGAGPGAFLAPGDNGVGTLTLQEQMILNADATYRCELDADTSESDAVSAKGVTLADGATFDFEPSGSSVLPAGTVFTVIDNSSRQPISGTFVNLPDGGTITSGSNTFQVSYEGGDGNDLTLTVL